MTNYANIMRDRAIHTPSITPIYPQLIVKNPNTVRNGVMPAGLKLDDLNFLDANNPLFHIDHVLYSAGQSMGKSQVRTAVTN